VKTDTPPSIVKKVYDFMSRDLWYIDATSLGRIKGFCVMSIRQVHVATRLVTQGELSMRAKSLVYTTLLSIVPLLAVSFSVLKAFGVHNKIEPTLLRLLAPLGENGPEITARIIGFVSNMKVGVLGSVGLAFLLYTVVSVIGQIESSFNFIWKVKKPRPLLRQFSNYVSVILVGPLLVFAAMGITATVMSSAVVQRLIGIGGMGVVVFISGKLLPYVFTCAAFSFMYIFIPNVKVKLRAGLAGGVFAGILWELSGWGFAKFVVTSTKYSAIYSGFAILVMFMLWVYLSWLILLIGSAVAFIQQYPQYQMAREDMVRLSNRMKERMAFSVMYLIGKGYHESGPAWTVDAFVERLGLPIERIQDILDELENRRILVKTGDDEPYYLPARDMDTIPLSDILLAVRTAEEDSHAGDLDARSPAPVDALSCSMSAALSGTVEGRSLRDLISGDAEARPAGIKCMP
jgi:membrane protein